MKSTDVTLNVIPLELEEKSKRFSFFESKPDNGTTFPLTPQEMPVNVADMYTEPIYTDFTENLLADMTVTVKYELSPRFAKHYLNYRIYQWFEDKAYLRKRNFIQNNEFYFKSGTDEKNDIAEFERYRIRGTYGRLTDGFELTIIYSGTMNVWLKPIYEYRGESTDFSTVVYQKELYRYENLMEQTGINRKEVFPVINRDVAAALNLPRPPWKKINKLKRYTENIDRFYKKFICDADFVEQFKPSPNGFLKVNNDSLNRIPVEASNLLFGEGITDKNPYEGLKSGGPFQPPPVSHIELFLIVSEKDAGTAGNQLYKMMRDGTGHFGGLNSFARIPVNHSEHHMTFSNTDNPLPEIRQKLQQMHWRENVHYGALYISPIHRDDPDPKKNQVYYRLKEELLKYDITSQVVDVDSVTNPSFAYYLPNISLALIAKLGGIPWTLERKQKNELVIGVGAYSPRRKQKKYLGSAFCFSNNGDFRSFDSFTADDHLMLAGSFQKAIKQFKEENEGVERLVIHFYKRMNREEARMIKRSLKELGLDIPIVIITIRKTASQDLVLSDRSVTHNLPLSGTWMKSGPGQYLLCNNTRFDLPDDSLKSFPFPIKVYIDIAGNPDGGDGQESYREWRNRHLNDNEWVEELLTQVYQFSRLNWQTIRVKALPVTVRYPEMVARKFPFFEGEAIPEFGKRNFWFL
ncbi:Piwi domain-containing protein [Rhodohalobacter sp. 614A]|uniref:Piwi domain-containing protein n=1 Tax=Rhodohalobacter sp. 614A TaxID=2908649 RepID=UPI001F28F3BE|nr:Piwi domain-containing protein [Rhodohalobacter sp. 614A]